MKKNGCRWFWIAAMALLMGSPSVVRSQTRSTGWHTNLETAAKLSAKTGKPVMVVFRCER